MAIDDPVTVDDIPWHRPAPTYNPETHTLTRQELDTLTECEGAVEALTSTELAVWICDLLAAREALDTTLHATMDALHRTLILNKRLQERVRQLLGIIDEP